MPPIFFSEERKLRLGPNDVAEEQTAARAHRSFAGGQFTLKFGRPGKAMHPDDKTPSHDFPMKVTLEQLMGPHIFDVAFTREAFCALPAKVVEAPKRHAPCPLCTSSGGGATSDELGTTRTTRMLGNEFVTSSKITCPLCMGTGELQRLASSARSAAASASAPPRSHQGAASCGAPEGYKYVLSGVGR